VQCCWSQCLCCVAPCCFCPFVRGAIRNQVGWQAACLSTALIPVFSTLFGAALLEICVPTCSDPPFVARIPLQTAPSPPPSTRSPSTCPNKPSAALPNVFPRARIRRFVTRPQVLPSVRRAAGFQRVRWVGAICGRACRSLTVGSSEGRMLRQLQKRRQASKRPPAGALTRMNSEYWRFGILARQVKNGCGIGFIRPIWAVCEM
jgi:hypothetical protein